MTFQKMTLFFVTTSIVQISYRPLQMREYTLEGHIIRSASFIPLIIVYIYIFTYHTFHFCIHIIYVYKNEMCDNYYTEYNTYNDKPGNVNTGR